MSVYVGDVDGRKKKENRKKAREKWHFMLSKGLTLRQGKKTSSLQAEEV